MPLAKWTNPNIPIITYSQWLWNIWIESITTLATVGFLIGCFALHQLADMCLVYYNVKGEEYAPIIYVFVLLLATVPGFVFEYYPDYAVFITLPFNIFVCLNATILLVLIIALTKINIETYSQIFYVTTIIPCCACYIYESYQYIRRVGYFNTTIGISTIIVLLVTKYGPVDQLP